MAMLSYVMTSMLAHCMLVLPVLVALPLLLDMMLSLLLMDGSLLDMDLTLLDMMLDVALLAMCH